MMNGVSLADWLTAIATIVAALTLLIGGCALYNQFRSVRQTLFVAVFNEFTRRFSEITHELPAQISSGDPSYLLENLPEPEQMRIMNMFRQYTNLCSEEHHLNSRNFIDRETWQIWVQGMEVFVDGPQFRKAWPTLKKEYRSSDFVRFFESLMATRISKA